MKSTVLLLVLASCSPAAMRVGADHPASPDAPAGRVAGPPPALDPSKFEPPPPPLPSTAATRPEVREPEPSKQPAKKPPAKKPPAKQPPAKQPPKQPPQQPPGHDHHGHH